jgi:predicted short-subunit dehydrogenase-like oxidoreductase (DUF2520 family)
VGAGLARSLSAAGVHVTLRAARDGLPARPIRADLIIVAVRDRDVPRVAEALRGKIVGRASVVHCAGALGPDALAAVRSDLVSVAQMHPMIAYASKTRAPSLLRGQLHCDGDRDAVRASRAVGRLLGMSPRTIPGLNRTLYHAAAGLVANGAAALAAAGVDLLERAGVSRDVAARMLGPLLRTVGDNVEALGLPEALTGPVRRGDVAGIERHLVVLDAAPATTRALYRELSLAQLPLARQLGEAEPAAFDAIEARMRPAP